MTKETVEAVILVNSFFKDYEKTAHWLSTQNLNIGGTTPIQLLNSGRGKKLISFIKTQLASNEPPPAKELPPLDFKTRKTHNADQAQRLIDEIYSYDLSANFDFSFIESVENQIEMRGWVSENQLQALQNILHGVQEHDELQGEGPVY